jgi:hypothetical protein
MEPSPTEDRQIPRTAVLKQTGWEVSWINIQIFVWKSTKNGGFPGKIREFVGGTA